MSKPLGYYVDTDIPVIGDIERKYGSSLEGMHQEDKVYLIAEIADQIFRSLARGVTDEVIDFGNRIKEEISEGDDVIGFIKAIANSL